MVHTNSFPYAFFMSPHTFHEFLGDYRYDNENHVFIARKKFDSGMTGQVKFDMTCYNSDSRILCAEMEFTVVQKRKHKIDYSALTGRDRLEPLLWAGELLDKFPAFIGTRTRRFDTLWIEIYPSDGKRRKAYSKVLGRKGFLSSRIGGSLYMRKSFTEEECRTMAHHYESSFYEAKSRAFWNANW